MSERLEFVRDHLTPKLGWAAIFTIVVGHDVACKQGNTLSEGVDRVLDRSPVAKYATIAAGTITLAHLLNIFESLGIPEADPFSKALAWKDRVQDE